LKIVGYIFPFLFLVANKDHILQPQELLYLSKRAWKELDPKNQFQSRSGVTFKEDYTPPSEQERWASYGISEAISSSRISSIFMIFF
jgi:hypothetical protein